ncbi:hypothetical protein JCM18237_19790 [Halorubrum luteum]
MDALLLAVLVGIPLAWLVGFAVYAYLDAPNHGMSPRKWAAISFFVPLFGFFAYLFEREERDYDPEEDPYATGETTFAVHESRRGEKPFGPAGTRADETDDDEESDEWNDPPGVDP